MTQNVNTEINMEVRITYRSEIYIKGDTLKDIRDKYESLNLDPTDKDDESITDYGFCETISVEDANSYKDLISEYWKAYD